MTAHLSNNPHYEAFSRFMQAHQDMVYATAVRLLASRTQAQDIAQEVFLRAYEQFGLLQHDVRAAGWLKTVATNLSLNHLKRHRRRWRLFSELSRNDDESKRQSDDAIEPDMHNTNVHDQEWLGADMDELLDQLHEAECQQYLHEALQELPEHQRVPLVLYHFDAQPYAQIADQLGVSLAKVKVDILRGRAALARRVAALMPKGRKPWTENESLSDDLASRTANHVRQR